MKGTAKFAAMLMCVTPMLLIFTGIRSEAQVKEAQVKSEVPPKQFIDVGACPFECCPAYGQWNVDSSVSLLDRPNGQRTVGTLQKGDIVRGIIGEMISEPIATTASRDIPETPIRKGAVFYVLHYDGEGYWKVWINGATALVHQSVMDVPHPKEAYWVKVKTTGGVLGWATWKGHFLASHDSCQ